MNRALYFVHRWLGLVVATQLLAWSLGGLMFSLLDIDDVHGDLDRASKKAGPLPTSGLVDVASIFAKDERLASLSPTKAMLVERRGRIVWQFDVAEGGPLLFDANDGARLERLDAEEAKRTALADVTNARGVIDAVLFERDPPIEYREKPLPAWRVTLDHAKDIHIYVHAVTGEVTARRNAKWRLFDFFYMLHVMDYSGREDFQHPWLTAFALLAVLASTSGLVLWGTRAGRKLKRT